MRFWDIVNAYLDSNGLELAWLARRAGVSRDTLSSQRTRDTVPRLDTACAIARVMRCSLEYLATGEKVGLPDDLDQISRQICDALADLDDDGKTDVLVYIKNRSNEQEQEEREASANPSI